VDAKLEKKLKKALPDAFLTNIQSAQDVELFKVITDSAIHIEEVEDAQKNDEEIEKAYAAKEVLVAPYRDSLRVLKAKIRYCKALLADRGKL
jgi:hypothetical protein